MGDLLNSPGAAARTKLELYARLERLDDAAALAKLHALLDAVDKRHAARRLLDDHLEVFDPHHDPHDHLLQKNLPSPPATPLIRRENWVHPLMFGATVLYFLLFSLLLAWASLPSEAWASLPPELPPDRIWYTTLFAWLALWWVFVAEYLGLALPEGAARGRLLYVLFPFARLVAPRISNPRERWLPRWGWCIGNTALVEALQKRLDWPLTLVALLILPVLAGELVLASPETHPGWLWMFDLVEYPIIWLAFALEFTLLLALTRDKLDYAIRRWMDIVIILLPLVSFLRVLRVVRVLRVGQLARTYRLRVLTRRSVILAMAVWRLVSPHLPRNHAVELRKLRQQLAANQRAHELLEQKIADLLADYHQEFEEAEAESDASGRNATT